MGVINGDGDQKEFDMSALKYSLQKVTYYCQDYSNHDIKKEADTKKACHLSYDESDGILYKGEEVFIEVDGQSYEGQILGLFFPCGSPTEKEFCWEEIFDDIASHADTNLDEKQKKDRIYKAIKRLNDKAIKKDNQPIFKIRNSNYRLDSERLNIAPNNYSKR